MSEFIDNDLDDQPIVVSNKTSFPFMIIPEKIWLMNLKDNEFKLFCRLIHYANQANNKVWPSRRTLIKALYTGQNYKWSEAKHDAAMKRLIELNMVEKHKRKRENGSLMSNNYFLLDCNVWTLPLEKQGYPTLEKQGYPTLEKQGYPYPGKTGVLEPDPIPEPDPNKQDQRSGTEDITPGCFAPPSPPVYDIHSFELEPQTTPTSVVKPSTLHNVYDQTEQARVARKTTPKTPKPQPEKTEAAKVWDIYAVAYQNKYGCPPVRNAKQNAICSQLVTRLGGGAAAVVQFYLGHKNRFYVEHTHALGLLLKDAESLHTQMQRGQQMTSTLAHQTDKQGALGDVASRAMERWAKKRKEEELEGVSK